MHSDIHRSVHQVDLGEHNFEVLKKIRVYLRRMIDAGGSDLHVKANAVVRARINGEIIPISGEIFSKDDALIF
ncbi:MAG: type IV pili twitching motility protein PilT, partial [Epsilonproteobacteria bacterium]|nr:type IV pili twitching motility protein PilT [Campylobacterota bacterium]